MARQTSFGSNSGSGWFSARTAVSFDPRGEPHCATLRRPRDRLAARDGGNRPVRSAGAGSPKGAGVVRPREATDNAALLRRGAMLFQVKRMLTAHALAEEDIVYPMLHDDAHRAEEAKKLYREHAEMKVRVFELEHKAKDDPSWIDDLRALRRIVADHAREEEQREFPKLRAALGERRTSNLLGEVHREKSMLL